MKRRRGIEKGDAASRFDNGGHECVVVICVGKRLETIDKGLFLWYVYIGLLSMIQS